MSKIEWTERTWNPTTGCNKVSQGCKNCYAEKMHKRLMALKPEKYHSPFLDGVQTHPDELIKPLLRKKPTMWFVNSMSDLFHDDVPFDFIDEVFAVMICARQHSFQVLTKRPDRMYEYLKVKRDDLIERWAEATYKVGISDEDDDVDAPACYVHNISQKIFPPQNIRIGTSCEDQLTFNTRGVYIAYLATLGWRTMLSLEPLLGPINLLMDGIFGSSFHWVITGGESGHNARPVHPDWVRSLRDQCAAAGVPFFFKQWGEWLPDGQYGKTLPLNSKLRMSADKLNLWAKLGKTKSGHLLDGVEHHEFPSPVSI